MKIPQAMASICKILKDFTVVYTRRDDFVYIRQPGLFNTNKKISQIQYMSVAKNFNISNDFTLS